MRLNTHLNSSLVSTKALGRHKNAAATGGVHSKTRPVLPASTEPAAASVPGMHTGDKLRTKQQATASEAKGKLPEGPPVDGNGVRPAFSDRARGAMSAAKGSAPMDVDGPPKATAPAKPRVVADKALSKMTPAAYALNG